MVVILLTIISLILFFCFVCKARLQRIEYEEEAADRARRDHLASLDLQGSERRQEAVDHLTEHSEPSAPQISEEDDRTKLIEKCICTTEVTDEKELRNLISALRHSFSENEEQSSRGVLSIAWDSARERVRSNNSTPECSICLDDYVEGEKIAWGKTNECNHVFHEECINLWLKENDDCPLCRCNLLAFDETVEENV